MDGTQLPRGLGWFPDFWEPDVQQAVTAVDDEVAALEPALLAPETTVFYGPDGGERPVGGARDEQSPS